MSDAITPALTPEEWAGRREDFENEWAAGHNIVHRLDSGFAVEFWTYTRGPSADNEETSMSVSDGDDSYDGDEVTVSRRHALAALALHQQPFGFTREDLWQLDQAIIDAEQLPREDGQVARLRSLYARLAALLPPEDV